MSRFLLAALLALTVLIPVAHAEEFQKPDDHVVFDLSAEDWVTTKTAHVTLGIEVAVSGGNAGSMRADMNKAVNDLAKADWRLTAFDRSQDQTGLERWSASYEARLPENMLNGLADNAKKLSKAGLQLSVTDIDFTPTLEEKETIRAAVRTQIYKSANEQLALLNSSLTGRNYRIAMINFTGDETVMPTPQVMRGMAPKSMMMSSSVSAVGSAPSMERSEKILLSARVVYAANPPPSPSGALDHH